MAPTPFLVHLCFHSQFPDKPLPMMSTQYMERCSLQAYPNFGLPRFFATLSSWFLQKYPTPRPEEAEIAIANYERAVGECLGSERASCSVWSFDLEVLDVKETWRSQLVQAGAI
jgi:hypothetical protein